MFSRKAFALALVLAFAAPCAAQVQNPTPPSGLTNIANFGAVGDGSTDNTTAINNAITATPIGGLLVVPGYNFNIAGTLTVAHAMTLQCSGANAAQAGSITATTTTADLLHINASNVTIRDCYFNRQGTPTTGKGIAVGTDSTSITDAACNGTATITSAAQANWTSADIGKRIVVIGCGVTSSALFATIVSINNPLSIVVTPAAGGTFSGKNSKYGFVYTDVMIDNVAVSNSNIGIHFIDAARFHVRDSYTNSTATGAEGMRVQNAVAADFGDSFVSGATFLSNDNTAGYGIHYESSGGLKIVNSKFLGGKYNFFLDWNLGQSGALQIANSSLETCGTSSIFISTAAPFNTVTINGNHISCGAPNIVFDNAATSVVSVADIIGNSCTGGGGMCIDLGQVNYATVTGNESVTGGGNPAINVRSTCTTCMVSANRIFGATLTVANASTTTIIDDLNGMTTASLPSVAANGSRIFATDADPATACTHVGAQTGSTAFRQNGAWKCF